MKQVLIKPGRYPFEKTIKIPSTDMYLIGESSAILIPTTGILPIEGLGNEDILCVNCSYLLANRVVSNTILITIKCPSCGIINRF